MFEFIQRHLKLVVIALVTIIVLVLVLIFTRGKNTNQNTNTQTVTEDGLIIDDTTQYLTDSKIPQADKYLMLLAQEMVENFGTVKSGNTGNLLDLYNQSTPEFSAKVQRVIDSTSPQTDTITVADPGSIELQQITGSQYRVSMFATTTDNVTNKTTESGYAVLLVKVNNYWLVKDIIPL